MSPSSPPPVQASTSQAVTQGGQSPPKSPKEELADEFKSSLFVSPRPENRPFPKRPKNLAIGTPIQLITNHFLLRVGKSKAYHYDIEIESAPNLQKKGGNVVDKEFDESKDKDKKKNKYSKKMATELNRKIFAQMVRDPVFRGINPVYDGQKNMFCSKILAKTEEKVPLRLKVSLGENGREQIFFVNIKMAETNNMIDLNILNLYHSGKTCDDEVVKKSVLFINTLLRHNATMDWVPIGQSIFKPNELGQRLGHYLTLSYGFYTSVRNLMVGPTYNVDRSAAAFYDSSIGISQLLGFIIKGDLSKIPANGISDYQRRQIKKELSGLRVEAKHVKYGTQYRKYRILGITKYYFFWSLI